MKIEKEQKIKAKVAQHFAQQHQLSFSDPPLD
jgi:hypothetical protein